MSPSRLPYPFAETHQVVLEPGRIVTGPEPTLHGLAEARRRANGHVTLERLSKSEFELALARIYTDRGNGFDGDELDHQFDLEEGETGYQTRDLLDEAEDAPVIRIVNQFLRRAVLDGASDLHVEPHEGGLRVRMRVDGFLQTIMNRSDLPVRRIVSRLKVMAGLDIAETRLPQDGRIPLRLGGRQIDTRVSSLPSQYGERIVLRILDRSSGLKPLHELGLHEDQVARLQKLSALPNGIILATGPTGAGKTTTLYSLLDLADTRERNVVTVEDPVEYDLPDISQTQINSDIGMTFAAGLRATLRQDPDVILVGEIRDNETASVAAQAALTGHLVFSSLHANGSVEAVVRLRDLGVDNYLIGATLRAAIAQRLLRRVCLNCSTAEAPTARDAALFDQVGVILPTRLMRAVGCERCNNTGYVGRVGIFEITIVDETLRTAIGEGASETKLRHAALRPEDTLLGQGMQAVARGDSTVDEVLRIVGDAV